MKYMHVTEKQNYETLASWRVLYSVPGLAPFPVRLVDEIFQRCCVLVWKNANLRLYDPCVGSWYMMTVLWLLHYEKISTLVWSDINEKALWIAKKNFSLLTTAWLHKRIEEIQNMCNQFWKDSHKSALEDAKKILSTIILYSKEIETNLFISSISAPKQEYFKQQFDIIIFDAPYWNLTQRSEELTWEQLYDSLWGELTSTGVLVVITDKKSPKIKNVRTYTKTSHFNHGKRRITFLKK